MADALDWLRQMLGGGQDAQPQQPGGLSALFDAISGSPTIQAMRAPNAGAIDLSAATGLPPAMDSSLGQGTIEQPVGMREGIDARVAGAPLFGVGATRVSRGSVPSLEPKYPQYAEEYPPVGPPNIKPKETGGTFEQKQLTPEAQAFADERLRINKDMAARGYEPYFNPANRSYVDPSNYPPANADTSTIVPQRAATVLQYSQAIGAPETTAALRQAYDKGIALGNADHWYAMAQLEKKYIDGLGPEAGRKAFLDEFAAPMAATTSGQNPTANLLMSHYLEFARKRGEQPPAANQLPYPVGGRYAQNNLDDYTRMRAEGGYSGLGLNQPKMHDFSRSMIGDLSNPVMDEQMATGMLAHAPVPVQKGARNTAYGMLQQPVRDLAAELNAANPTLNALPGNIQDVAWAGFKNEPGQPMISIVNDAIERTHRLTGMSRDEIVRRGLVGKEIPLYGLGGLGLGLGGLGGLGGGNGQGG